MEVARAVKYSPFYSGKLKKQLELLKRRGYNMDLFKTAVTLLITGEPLPPRYQDHQLHGKWKGYRGLHIKGDWILVYRIEQDNLILVLVETGTHSDVYRN